MTTPRRQLARLTIAAIAAAIATAALVFVLAYRTHTGEKFRHQSAENCQQIESLKEAFRLFIKDVMTPLPGHHLTDQQRQSITRIQHIAETRFAPKGCAST